MRPFHRPRPWPLNGLLLGLALVLASGAWSSRAAAPDGSAEPPSVVVSIAPVYSLVAAVMQGVGAPTLLVRPGASPHDFSLKPSDAIALEQADLVIWVGPAMESFLVKALQALPKRATIVTLMDQPGMMLLRQRAGGPFERDEDAPAVTLHRPGGGRYLVDGHFWLDPDNGAAILRAVAVALAARDPAHATRYHDNAAAAIQRLTALDRDLKASLAPLAHRPFLVFHDAYQYFDRHYGLRTVGSVTIEPEQKPGARRLLEIRTKMLALKVRCAFREPQFPPSLLETITEGTSIQIGVLDPLGADIPPGPGGYEALLRQLTSSLRQCLAQTK